MNTNIPSKISRLNGYPLCERGRLTNEQFAKARAGLEELVQAPLPPQYLDFVREYGVYGVEATVRDQELPVAVFLGLNPDFPDDAFDLVRAYHFYRERIPQGTLPICYDDYGSVFLLDLKTSAVSFFDHETERSTPIAQNFISFLEQLEPLPEDDLAQ